MQNARRKIHRTSRLVHPFFPFPAMTGKIAFQLVHGKPESATNALVADPLADTIVTEPSG
jgi:hypothetical protein